MIITWRVVLRLAALVFAAAIIQTAFFSTLNILGAIPNAMPVLAVCLGLLGGAVLGAVCGFAAGLLLDVLLLQTLGVFSVVLLVVGYLAGRFRESFPIASSLTPPLLAGGLTLLAAAMFAAVQLILGVEAPVGPLIVREIAVQGLLGFLLAIPIYPGVRRALRAALVADAPGRRGSVTAASPLGTTRASSLPH